MLAVARRSKGREGAVFGWLCVELAWLGVEWLAWAWLGVEWLAWAWLGVAQAWLAMAWLGGDMRVGLVGLAWLGVGLVAMAWLCGGVWRVGWGGRWRTRLAS